MLGPCSQVDVLKKDLAEVDSQLARTEKLLRIADPDQWYKPSAKAVQVSKERAQQLMEAEKKRKAKTAAANEKRKASQAAQLAPEEEEEEAGAAGAAAAGQQQQQPGASGQAPSSKPGISIKPKMPVNYKLQPAAAPKAGLQIRKPSALAAPNPEPLPTTTVHRPDAAQPTPPSKKLSHPPAVKVARHLPPASGPSPGASSHAAESKAAAQVMADLEMLSRSRQQLLEETDSVPEEAMQEWQAPQGQSGDGRTKLNDLYGY